MTFVLDSFLIWKCFRVFFAGYLLILPDVTN